MAGDALDRLRGSIRATIREHCPVVECREALFEVLARPGFALHPDGPCRAGLFTLGVYRAIAGRVSPVSIQASCAVELCMEAAYLFDNVADHETGDPRTPAEELALAIVLMSCSGALAQAAYGAALDGPAACLAAKRFHRQCARAATGQFLDAHFERRTTVHPRGALLMTALKAGSLGRIAGGTGAAIATKDTAVQRCCENLGFNLFTFGQLVDDLRDANRSPKGGSGDLDRGKTTIPVVFYERHRRLSYCASERGTIGPPPRETFDRCGAAMFGRLVAEVFLNRARRCVADLRGRGFAVEYLARTVEELTPAA